MDLGGFTCTLAIVGNRANRFVESLEADPEGLTNFVEIEPKLCADLPDSRGEIHGEPEKHDDLVPERSLSLGRDTCVTAQKTKYFKQGIFGPDLVSVFEQEHDGSNAFTVSVEGA